MLRENPLFDPKHLQDKHLEEYDGKKASFYWGSLINALYHIKNKGFFHLNNFMNMADI